MKTTMRLLPLVICILASKLSLAQADSSVPRIAVFAPLYLDSAFDNTMNYRYGNNFPKFLNPGLEFYEGLQIAVDSLQKEGVKLEVHVFDTRGNNSSVSKFASDSTFRNTDLIIGHITGSEARTLADIAARNNIPFINVNYPNDAGITNNPNYIILNSTIATHCAALYKFLQKNYSTSDIIFLKRKGKDEKLEGYFTELTKTTSSVPLKMKTVSVDDELSGKILLNNLDSNKSNIIVAATLDVNFAANLLQAINGYGDSYQVTVLGMPNWDNIEMAKSMSENLELIYGTPFYVNPADKKAESIHQYFKTKFYSRPSDMVYRGYETLYHFGHLLTLHGANTGSSLSDKRFRAFNDFDIQPVLDQKTMTLDYFENRKVYFVKKVAGVVKAVY
ncbi:MAG TPA: ABC transporter substrate-binding protein [Flavitalea sp.]|nr:ABC transporter substrate-binding protein [Flavitalea sp.]